MPINDGILYSPFNLPMALIPKIRANKPVSPANNRPVGDKKEASDRKTRNEVIIPNSIEAIPKLLYLSSVLSFSGFLSLSFRAIILLTKAVLLYCLMLLVLAFTCSVELIIFGRVKLEERVLLTIKEVGFKYSIDLAGGGAFETATEYDSELVI